MRYLQKKQLCIIRASEEEENYKRRRKLIKEIVTEHFKSGERFGYPSS